jgi:hypothetical protein
MAMARANTVPDFLRVEEAARVLRIGRTSAYELAREFLVTGGASGLPVVRIGRQLRVPRRRLEDLAGGPISLSARITAPDRRPSLPRLEQGADQSTLPFPA